LPENLALGLMDHRSQRTTHAAYLVHFVEASVFAQDPAHAKINKDKAAQQVTIALICS
jgi:hypothetical protein